MQRGLASAYARPGCPQRADPCKAVPRPADRDGPHTASWILTPDQDPMKQELPGAQRMV